MRFPEFTEPWERRKLSEFATKITKKNRDNTISNVLSNSATLGIVQQSQYFEREIVTDENLNGYYVINKDDFVYNPRKSVSAPCGPVNKYDGKESGIISPLYLCFTVNNINRSSLLWFFKSPKWYRYIYLNGDSGVRHDRVSIKDDLFLDMPITIPLSAEQEKISKLFELIDRRIAVQSGLIEKLESLISGIIERLTAQSPNVRISDCLECHSSTLQENQLNDTGGYRVYGANGICGYTDSPGINGDAILIVKDGSGVGNVSYAIGEYSVIGTSNYLTAKNGYSLRYLYYSLMKFNFAPYKTGMAIPHIYFKDYGKAKIYCPSLEEQERIASNLSKIERKIEIERSIKDNCIMQKQYLLQQMFI